ncbi:Ankyrin repeat protein [Zostera marina]|uniref:Ankyrin repeat protein n=1 Tax=Zostera marina TaxID=29655 RepID=A0A0K9P4S7_ZOSMR|nr:Ankyrin repeat protein [Zostera marina]
MSSLIVVAALPAPRSQSFPRFSSFSTDTRRSRRTGSCTFYCSLLVFSQKNWSIFVAPVKNMVQNEVGEEEGHGEGFWEVPDVSGYDDDESQIGDEDSSSSSTEKNGLYYLEIPEEIELLLSAEENAILQQNQVPNLTKISSNNWNPLHSLALSGQIPIMDKLLEDNTHIDMVDKNGFTVFHKAVIGKKEAVISHLLRKGADIQCKDRDGITPLHYAVQVGAIQTVKLLIKHKVNVNVADNDGWTPLHIAVQSRSRDITKVLLINGADKTRRTRDGKTPLDIALCFGKEFKSYELTKLLKLVPYGDS